MSAKIPVGTTHVPRMMFLTKGVGVDKNRLSSFELALRAAGIERFNLVYVSSILPPNCKIVTRVEGLKELVDGQIVASVQPRTLDGHPWPVREDRVTDLRDVAKAVLALARAAGVSPQMLAQAMGDNGLPTTAARLKNISTMEQGRRSATSPAELVAMCYAAIAVLNDEKTS